MTEATNISPQVTTGVWKISWENLWVRDVGGQIQLSPEEGEQGDHRSMWRLDYKDEQRGDAYTITNIATGINAWAAPPDGLMVSAGEAVKWVITPTGNDQQHIQWPNADFYWTAKGFVPGLIELEGLRGLPTQVWKFKWVGDF